MQMGQSGKMRRRDLTDSYDPVKLPVVVARAFFVRPNHGRLVSNVQRHIHCCNILDILHPTQDLTQQDLDSRP